MSEERTDMQTLRDLATRIRIHSVESTSAADSGHPTTCSSCAEILSVLFFHTMRYKVSSPKDAANDRFILSKGHAAPALYAAWAEAGLFPVSDLKNLRTIGSDLEGHPTPRLNFIDVGTGSLGQGLAVANGMAYVGKYIDQAPYRIYTLIGDGESTEGSIWESIAFASRNNLDNLVLIVDANRLGQAGPTPIGHNIDEYKKRLDAFGFNTLAVDGHDVEALVGAFDSALKVREKPTAIVAKTFKGKDFPGVEDREHFHGKAMGADTEKIVQHLKTLMKSKCDPKFTILKPLKEVLPVNLSNVKLSEPPSYTVGKLISIRTGYGNALVKLSKTNKRVIAIDADVKNSTFSKELQKYDCSKFIESYIAEQNAVGVAIGAACRDRTIPFISTFAAFLTRAFDQIRMAAISLSNINLCGSHCGCSIGPDGASQMGLEDIAMFRTIPNCTVFYPSDVVAVERAVELAANTKGMTFIRTTRPDTLVIYPNDTNFQIGKAHIVRCTKGDKVLLITAGILLQEAFKAADELAKSCINIRVLDPFTIKPIDKAAIISNANEVGGKILVVEDHYPEGGIGEAVLAATAEELNIYVKHVAVQKIPHSGTTADVLDSCGISAKHIVCNVQQMLKK